MNELTKFQPCSEALDFRDNYKTFEEAWDNCPRGDWMLWIAVKLKVNERRLTLAKGYCAKTVIHLMKNERSINAVNTAIGYGRYKNTNKELNADADAAAAAYAADAAAADAAYARKKNQLLTANICRKYLTKDVFKSINRP